MRSKPQPRRVLLDGKSTRVMSVTDVDRLDLDNKKTSSLLSPHSSAAFYLTHIKPPSSKLKSASDSRHLTRWVLGQAGCLRGHRQGTAPRSSSPTLWQQRGGSFPQHPYTGRTTTSLFPP